MILEYMTAVWQFIAKFWETHIQALVKVKAVVGSFEARTPLISIDPFLRIKSMAPGIILQMGSCASS